MASGLLLLLLLWMLEIPVSGTLSCQFFFEVMADRVARVAFPAEAAAEMRDERGSTLDNPGNDTMPVPLDEDLSKAVDREKDLLDAMPLPGTPVDEAERRRSWIALPLRVRTAILRTVWASIINGFGTNLACSSGSSRVHSGMPTISV